MTKFYDYFNNCRIRRKLFFGKIADIRLTAVSADLGFGRVGVEVVATVDAQTIHQSDTDSVFGTSKTAPRAKNTIIAETEFSVLERNIIHGTALDA